MTDVPGSLAPRFLGPSMEPEEAQEESEAGQEILDKTRGSGAVRRLTERHCFHPMPRRHHAACPKNGLLGEAKPQNVAIDVVPSAQQYQHDKHKKQSPDTPTSQYSKEPPLISVMGMPAARAGDRDVFLQRDVGPRPKEEIFESIRRRWWLERKPTATTRVLHGPSV